MLITIISATQLWQSRNISTVQVNAWYLMRWKYMNCVFDSVLHV